MATNHLITIRIRETSTTRGRGKAVHLEKTERAKTKAMQQSLDAFQKVMQKKCAHQSRAGSKKSGCNKINAKNYAMKNWEEKGTLSVRCNMKKRKGRERAQCQGMKGPLTR